MMRSMKKTTPPSGTSNGTTMDTLVGRQTELQGDITFSGGLHIDGTVKGKVSASGDKEAVLSISESGSIEGDVHVSHVVLNGSIHGDVYASGKLTLNSCARVNGNVHYKVMEMASGAMVNGQMVHEAESPRGSNVTSFDGRADSQSKTGVEHKGTLNSSAAGKV